MKTMLYAFNQLINALRLLEIRLDFINIAINATETLITSITTFVKVVSQMIIELYGIQ